MRFYYLIIWFLALDCAVTFSAAIWQGANGSVTAWQLAGMSLFSLVFVALLVGMGMTMRKNR